jgi:Cu(I)/Ag(I) efflux system membrane fusion protein
MNMKNIISNKYIQFSLFAVGGILLGWLFFHKSEAVTDKHNHTSEEAQATVWTCSMHPQIRMDKPGKCPICGMDLIPLNQSGGANIDPEAIHFTKEAAALANVMTSKVSVQKPIKEVRLYGKIQADERMLQSLVAHIPGRIEKLAVNFTGETVRRGQTIALIFSPELVTAQQELLEAVKTKDSQPDIYEAVKEKLQLWKIPESQINEIETSGKIRNNFEVTSGVSGVVTARRVNNGDYVSQGSVLYDIADLSKVWALFDAYESDLPFLSEGNKISFSVQALPGQTFSGNITFIDPVIDPVTRVSKVRIEIDNRAGKLKPEMFVTGVVNANLPEYANKMIIPRSAVLWTGKRSIVYVKLAGSDDPLFKLREIEIGPMLGNSYVVLNGLEEGEEIVTQGAFNVDAAAQLEGKPSMMNTSGSDSLHAHNHDEMVTDQSEQPEPETNGNKAFQKQLSTVFDQYIVLKDAFVKSNVSKIKGAAVKVRQSVSEVDMNLLAGNAHKQWMDNSNKLVGILKKIESANTLEEQRQAFVDLNSVFYRTVKAFGLSGKTIYYQFCPMANNDKGAYWLSTSEPIRNPYFGEAMLTCGENKETLKY